MKTKLSGGYYPQLISIEGEERNIIDMIMNLNLDNEDRAILSKGYVTPQEEIYLDMKHPDRPEMMGGFWGSLTKLAKKVPVVGGIISVGEGIADVVRGSKKSGSSEVDILRQQLALQQQQAEKNKKIMMIAIPAGVGLILVITMMQRKK